MPDDATEDRRTLPARPGDRVARYEILDVIGRGGMGVVYRARDLTLPREVALKCPWPGLASEPDIRLRFMREARTSSQISHPGIVAIHEVFEHERLPWIAMQLVEGRSLREELRERGALEVRDVLRYGVQLADALQAAHEGGVLHRDLTPRNVLIGRDGRVLLTDFGLARTLARPADPGSADTVSLELTRKSHVVGTPPYMSPEQVLDRPLDGRSDVFCLGLLLYEMCTGRQAFASSGLGVTVDAILHHDPPAVRSLAPAVPESLGQVISAAIAKDPGVRYGSAGALADDLRAVQRRMEFAEYAGEYPTGPQSAPFARRHRRRRLRHAALAGALGLAAVAVVWLATRDGARTFERPVLEALVTGPGDETASAVSPDGQWVSFLAGPPGRRHVWVKKPDGGQPVRVTSRPGNLTSQLWSPDGTRIAYLLDEAGTPFLQFIPAFGGPPTASVQLDPRFGDGRLVRWIGDGIWIDDADGGLLRWDVPGGRFDEVVAPGAIAGTAGRFDVSTGGERIAFTTREGDRSLVWVADLGGGDPVRLTPAGVNDYRPRWLGPGGEHLVFSSNRSGQIDLWLTRVPRGTPRQLTLSSAIEYAGATTPDGSVLTFEQIEESANLWRMSPETPRLTQLTADTLQDLWPSVAEAGGLLAFQRQKPRLDSASSIVGSQILLGRLSGDEVLELRPVTDRGGAARLSPDAARLAWVERREGDFELWAQDLGSGHARRVAEDYSVPWTHSFPRDWLSRNVAWAPDGSALYFVAGASGAQALRRFVPDDPETATTLAAGAPGMALRDLRPSADGRLLAFTHLDPWNGKRFEVRVLDLETGAVRVVHRLESGEAEAFSCKGWVRDGKTLLLLAGAANADWSERLQVLELGLDGGRKKLGEIDRAFSGTGLLDPARGVLYLTKIDDAGEAQNLYEFRLADGALRRLTDNRLAGVTFAGLEPGPGGSVLLTRYETNTDVWLIRYGH